jgi:hypothetical protein
MQADLAPPQACVQRRLAVCASLAGGCPAPHMRSILANDIV